MKRNGSIELRMLTWAALLIAIDIICARFLYVYTPGATDRISLQFVPNALAGMLLGPVWGALVCAAADILGFFTNNSSGYGFMPLLTLSAAARGLLYGLFLYKKPLSFKRVLLAVGVVTLVVDLGMNPVWLSILYGKAWMAMLIAKVPVRIISVPVYSILFYAVAQGLQRARIPGISGTGK